jgi:hypothetical protein
MWEHCILNELHAHLQTRAINYWRDKRNYEIDFVVHNRAHDALDAIECKFHCTPDDLSAGSGAIGKNFEAFRALYPAGRNFVVAHNIDHAMKKKYKETEITFVGAKDLIKALKEPKTTSSFEI